MNDNKIINSNPTESINISFSEYASKKKALTASHLQGGVPDYALPLEAVYRQKLTAIPGFFSLAKAMKSTVVPQIIKQMNLQSLKVGPNQLPEVYEMVRDCANTLGIGIPQCFIEYVDSYNEVTGKSRLNAYTIAYEDDTPIVVISADMLERATPEELKSIIGHECGHIHNNHGIYGIMSDILVNATIIGAQYMFPAAMLNSLLALASKPLQYALQKLSRAQEITCDRAGMICSEDPSITSKANVRLNFGMALGKSDVDVDAFIKQFDAYKGSSIRFDELYASHPLGARRALASREFLNCETLFSWRPELKTADTVVVSKQEVDRRCAEYLSLKKQ